MLVATDDYIKGILNALLKNVNAVRMIDVVGVDRSFWQTEESRITIHFMRSTKELEEMVRKQVGVENAN